MKRNCLYILSILFLLFGCNKPSSGQLHNGDIISQISRSSQVVLEVLVLVCLRSDDHAVNHVAELPFGNLKFCQRPGPSIRLLLPEKFASSNTSIQHPSVAIAPPVLSLADEKPATSEVTNMDHCHAVHPRLRERQSGSRLHQSQNRRAS